MVILSCSYVAEREKDSISDCLTFELTATRAARRLGGAVQHKPRRRAAQAACRVGSRLSEGLGRAPRCRDG